MARPKAGSNSVAMKRCPACYRDVLSAYRGEVTAVGKGEIAKVGAKGEVVGRCECGTPVIWEREASHPR